MPWPWAVCIEVQGYTKVCFVMPRKPRRILSLCENSVVFFLNFYPQLHFIIPTCLYYIRVDKWKFLIKQIHWIFYKNFQRIFMKNFLKLDDYFYHLTVYFGFFFLFAYLFVDSINCIINTLHYWCSTLFFSRHMASKRCLDLSRCVTKFLK